MYRKMKDFLPFKVIALFLLLAGMTACKSTERTQKEVPAGTDAELEELYWSRIANSRDSFTKADVMFMTVMIAHHAQALIMSRLAPENGAGPAVTRLASRIINAQKDEIASMQQWLRDRGQPVPEIRIEGLNLYVEIENKPYTSYKKMRGVLSDEQLRELAAVRGAAFDRLFLTYMIEHHSGAVHMVDKLFSSDGAAQDHEAFRLASGIQVDQKTEIERMHLMLERLSVSG